MVIHPEIIVTPDTPTIKFRAPREQVELDTELPRLLHGQGWGCGTYFNVQFISHDSTKLLFSALFVVSEETESLQTNEANPYQPVTKTVFTRKAERISEWWGEDHAQVGGAPIDENQVVWNSDKKRYEVMRGDVMIFQSTEQLHARRVADGRDPLTG